jgi:subtilase family serine protease
MANSTITRLPVTLLIPIAILAQSGSGGGSPRRLIMSGIDESQLHTLTGNTHPQANPVNDRGLVPDTLPMQHMLLQLKRPAEQEQAIRQFLDQLHAAASSSFHHWLTASQFGAAYGPAPQDIDSVTAWLQGHGFTVNQVHPSGMLLDFSGTASQVRSALHTEIHYLNVSGRQHIGNMSDPQIPMALAPASAGVVSLHDFKPHAMHKRANFTFNSGGVTNQALTPADLAAIYNFTPLFAPG